MLAGAALLLVTACSGKADDMSSSPSAGASTSTSATPTTGVPSSASPERPLPDLTAAQVVAAFAGKNYECSTDEAYETCSSGLRSVQVLIGKHPRPPVISLQAAGPATESTTRLTEFAPEALELAHVNPRDQITAWLKQQVSKPAAKTTIGDWNVEYSTEVDTEAPGAILTLTDTLCKANCGAE